MAFACVKILCFGVILLLRAKTSRQQEEDIPHNEVKNWALKFGVDLWEFGKQVTKMNEIQRKYHEVDADVVRKDGHLLIREMAAEVKNMMDFKMNAVMRIMESAEQAAVSAPREVDSFTKYYASHRLNLFTKDKRVAPGAREMILIPNRHFDQLAVNVSLSAVLLPPGVKDTDPEVAAGVQWSEILDPLFTNNYESDPSLSWQFFGATSGFLRRFPAISWPPESTTGPSRSSAVVRDVYDFRNSGWFVGGATSSKDLAILIDNGGHMSGNRRELAIATARAILGTLGPDDYVNVYRYAEGADEVVQCFKESMVQASPENVRELKAALEATRPQGTSNVSAALATAFEILHKYNRTGQGSQCNQAIMLITADTNGVPREIIKKYNWPHMPVRIFTYLVGGDRSPELRGVACTNKGYYARISNTDEIEEKVFEYIKVLARPMVLYQHDHPIHWTSVYVGGKSDRYGEERNGQLMTSVTVPILDRRNHTVKVANLLGIVGTDVPVEQIQKLVPPYKLGVNGYSFIVDNNGRILYHPDLRPLIKLNHFLLYKQPGNIDYEETLRPKYVSVDLSEVELAEYDAPSHPLNNSLLLDLRHDMIDQKQGETEFAVKIHYDNMRRVTLRRHKYFYIPIEGTPFSLGLALPEGYGMYEFLAEQEIKHAKFNVTEYFKLGDNWKVHPDWVYCEYNSGSDKWFATPEERVFHFLDRTRRPGWKWMSLRPRSPSSHHRQASKPDKDSYYCDKTLVQSLVLDALVTDGFDRRSTHTVHKEDKQSQGKGMFGVTRSFIATRSGLLRWHEHPPQDDLPAEATDEPHFADVHRRAMDSSWYKRAVDQHAVEPESFVFSVPFDAADSTKSLVTATHAVFVERKGHRAPAAVVGLQFQHSSLAAHFINITSTCSATTGCKKTCASEELDCYILDNGGFIIISESHEHTGKFFGEIDGTIMDSLVQDRIYRKVTVVDYQGVCLPQRSRYSTAAKTFSDSIVKTLVSIGGLLWSLGLKLTLSDLWGATWTCAEETETDDELVYTDDYETNHFESYAPDFAEEVAPETEELPMPPAAAPGPAPVPAPAPMPFPAPAVPPTTHATHATYAEGRRVRACEKKTDLYILQPERLNTSGQSNPLKGKLTNCHVTGCERPFSVQKIQHTNLILLVVDTLCPCGSKQLSIEPMEALTEPGACTARRERLYRRRPPKCINYHPEEMEIRECGGSSRVSLPAISIVTIVAILAPYLT